MIPKNTKRLKTKTVALGEHTGHHHTFVENEVDLFEKDGEIFVKVPEGMEAHLEHQEHNTQTIPARDYTIRRVQEYDHFAEEARNILD